MISTCRIREMLKLYFIMGSNNTGKANPLYVLEEALIGGITCFQFREKGTGSLNGQASIDFAKACHDLCKKYNVPFIINDDVELALSLDADGVHVGQDDESALRVRERIGDKILGVSVHTCDDVERAIAAHVDYVGIGPIFKTQTKDDAKLPAGTGFLQAVSQKYPELPIVGIGGITVPRVETVIQCGADGVSVISAISHSHQPQLATETFNKELNHLFEKKRLLQ